MIVGAHYDRISSPQRPLDNWSGAVTAARLSTIACKERKRSHSFVFVAFADNGNDPAGAEFFVDHLESRRSLTMLEAMINVDALGLSPTKVWTRAL